MNELKRAQVFSLFGALIALAITVGLTLVSVTGEGHIPNFALLWEEVQGHPLTYLYVLLASATALTSFGHGIGGVCDRALLLSITDPLTHLVNRRQFDRRLADERIRGLRTGAALSVLSIDLNNLKDINDELGHQAGDIVLTTLAKTLMETTRGMDVVARMGGDEFAVLLPHTSMTQAKDASLRVTAAIRAQTRSTQAFSVSIGVAELTAGDSKDVMASADAALYLAKAEKIPIRIGPAKSGGLTMGQASQLMFHQRLRPVRV